MFSNPEKILVQFGLAEGLRVADFGAGAGYYAMLLAQLVGTRLPSPAGSANGGQDSGKVYAIDINKDMLARLANNAEKEGLDNIEIICGNAEKEGDTSLADGFVDAVVIANTLFTMDNKQGAAKEAMRILKKKGRVLLVEWADSFAGMGPHRDHVIKKEEAQKIFTDAGFSLERELQAGDHHYGLVFRK